MWYMLEASQQQAEAQAQGSKHATGSSGDDIKGKDGSKDKDKDKEKERGGDEGSEKDKESGHAASSSSASAPASSPSAPPPSPPPPLPSLQFTVGRNNTSLLTEQQFPSRWHGLNDLWLAHVPSYLQDRLVYMRYMLRWAGLLDGPAYAAAVAHVKAHCRLEVDVLEVAEAMEAIRTGTGAGAGGGTGGGAGGWTGSGSKSGGRDGSRGGPSNATLSTNQGLGPDHDVSTSHGVSPTHLHARTPSSTDPAELERLYPPARRPGEDFRWYQTNCQGCGTAASPPPPEQRAAVLYDGMLLTFPPQREIWLFTNGSRR